MGLAHRTEQRKYKKVWEQHHGAIPKGMHIHHKDFNPYNHDISNLQLVTPEEHAKLHNHEGVKWATEAGKKGGRNFMKYAVTREWHSKGGKASKNPGGYAMSEQGKENIRKARLKSKKYNCIYGCEKKFDKGNLVQHMRKIHGIQI